MSELTCGDHCNHHGSCLSGKCSCDLGWFSANETSFCTIPGPKEWGDYWSFFKILFIILFLCVFIYSSLKLCLSLKQENTQECSIKCIRLFKSPKNLSLFGIILMSAMRVTWLSYDPLIFDLKSTRMTDRLLFESAYPILFTVLSSVILVWSGLYQGIRKKKRDPFKCIRKVILALMVVAYPLCWMVSINKGFRAEKSSWYWVGYISLGIGASFISLCYIVYSVLLLRYISANQAKNLPKPITLNSPLRQEITFPEVAQNSKTWIDFNSIENPSEYNESFSDEYPKEKKEIDQNLDKYFLGLSKGDKKLITKLLIMTSISGTSGFLIIAIGTPFTLYDALNSPVYTFVGLFLALFFEFGISLLMIIAFTTEVKNQEKENIKQMMFMARNIRHKESVLKLPSSYSHIYRRLRLYYL